MATQFRTLRHPAIYVSAFLFLILFRYFGRPLIRFVDGIFDDPATRLVIVIPAFLVLLGAVFGLMRIGGPVDPRDEVDFKLSGSEPRNSGTSEPPPTSV